MHDVMALVTDSVLGGAAWFFAARLGRESRMWAWAFVFTGIAAFCGGVFHALGDQSLPLWKATTFSVGIASFFLLAGTDRRLQAVAVVKLIAYLSWMIAHDEFVYVIADYGLTLILVAVFHPAKKWVLGSVGASVLGALVQQARISMHERWFDFNDLYHVIQMVALWMLYRAALEVVAGRADATESTTGRVRVA